MAPNTVRGDYKLCRGPLHRNGEWLPLRRFHHTKDGKPFASCKGCWRIYNNREGFQVPWDEVEPVLSALLQRLKTKAAICDRLGWARPTLSRGFASLHSSKFNLMVELLSQLEDEEPHYKKGEANIVDAEPLGSYLRAWVTRWLAERPANITNSYEDKDIGEYFMGPINWLSEKTGINVRRISGISNGEFERVPLSQADLLLTAIGENWRLSPEIGDIEVKPNPQWSMEQWLEYMRERGCY